MIRLNKYSKSYSNRGMSLESDINVTNDYYKDKGIALIYKKPTPIKTVDVKFDNAKNACITKAFFEKPSTTDYNGVYKSKYIDFEAKEVKDKDYFVLSNIHAHQIQHIVKVKEHGGISFIIVRFIKLNKTFLLESEKLEKFINESKRKSIPILFFEENGEIIKEGYCPRLDYIKVVDKLIFRSEKE